MALEAKERKPRQRNKERSNDLWENVVLKKFTDADWLENFRMSKNTFLYICKELENKLAPKPNPVRRQQITVQKKVAASVYFLASCCEYRVVANQFGIHKSTMCKILHEFVDATIEVLTPKKHIHMPNDAEAAEIAACLEHGCHIPNIIGAIDGSHIPILPSSDGYRDFVNRKGWPSIVLQAVVDHRYRFLNVSIKKSGATHDAAVLAESNLYKHKDKLIPKGSVQFHGQQLPYMIIGDPAYPLLPWLMKGYIDRGLTPQQDSFNAYMNNARVVVEIAFGRLKARWRCLMKRVDVHYSFVPSVVAVCCTLHNIVELYNDRFSKNWLQEACDEGEQNFTQPETRQNRTYDDCDAQNMRTFLTEHLANHFPLRSSKTYIINRNQCQ